MTDSLVVMGTNDAPCLGDGWFDAERDPRCGVLYRWTAPEASFGIQLPAGARGLRLLVSGAGTALNRPIPLSLYAGGQRVAHAPAAAVADAWTPVTLTFARPVAAADPATFTLRVEDVPAGLADTEHGQPVPFVPHLHLANGDLRRLGIMVAAIRAIA